MTLKKRIRKKWNSETLYENKNEYTIYSLDGMNVILSADEKLLRDYKKKYRKGQIKDIEDEYEIALLSKMKDALKISISPYLYYVMWSK